MATEKEGMVNGSSSTSRVSSNFILARTAPLVHCTPCRRFYDSFLIVIFVLMLKVRKNVQ
jgi:hypothetical protein